MADLSHELGALRFVVDSPLSSKVAMFNNQVQQHKNAQLLNPFSQTDGRASPKPIIDKEGYGKPLAGSLTEMRGQKANIHVLKEMLELCQIIDSEGYDVKNEPGMRVITFGELFNIYNYISDKCVGILLRARKHKLVEFEGEMLFQRRDDDVPIFLLKPVAEIRREMDDKIDSIKRASSPAPQATSVLLDKKGLNVPKGATPRSSVSRTPSPQSSKAGSPAKDVKAAKPPVAAPAAAPAPAPAPAAANVEKPKIQISGEPEPETEDKPASAEPSAPAQVEQPGQPEIQEAAIAQLEPSTEIKDESAQQPQVEVSESKPVEIPEAQAQTITQPEAPTESSAPQTEEDIKSDVNNNPADLPTVVVEASAIYVRSPAPVETTTAPEVSSTPAPESATVA